MSIGKAAEMIGVSTIEFKDILANKGTHRKVSSRSKKELNEGVELIKKLSEKDALKLLESKTVTSR